MMHVKYIFKLWLCEQKGNYSGCNLYSLSFLRHDIHLCNIWYCLEQVSNIWDVQILPVKKLAKLTFKYGLIMYFSEKAASQNLVPKSSNLKFDAYLYSIFFSSSTVYGRSINAISLMGDRLCTRRCTCRVIHKYIYVLSAPLLLCGEVI